MEQTTVTFDGSTSSDPEGPIASYHWDFGDGHSADGPTVQHAFADNGVFTVTLTVTDAGGKHDTDTAEVTVTNATKFLVVDGWADTTVRYGDEGSKIDTTHLAFADIQPRGVASNASGDTYWVIDANRNVYVYNAAGTKIGGWQAKGLSQPQDITTDGTDIWIVDAGRDKVFRYSGAASRRSGSQNASSSFALNSANKQATGLVTDGNRLWVTNDAYVDKVFVYSLAGALLGSWKLDRHNDIPSGIALDPTGASQDLWVVDRGDAHVYRYANAQSRTSGSQSAADTFSLDFWNAHPEGIADPPPVALDNTSQDASAVTSARSTEASAAAQAVPSPASTAAPLTAASNLVLTDEGEALGFSVSTFALGFPSGSNVGPLGIAFPASGGVLVSDYTGKLWRFTSDSDGQVVSDTQLVNQFPFGSPRDLSSANGTVYMTSYDGGGRIYRLSDDGSAAEVVIEGTEEPLGIAPNPVPDSSGHQHLFVATTSGILDVDPIAKTSSLFVTARCDGLSTDGTIVYGATNGRILGFSVATKEQVFDSGPIPGSPDGTALGTGRLAGYLYANTNTAGVWQIDLATNELIQIADGPTATRGDFVTVAPNGTLLATQTAEIDRITPPTGGGFGNAHVTIDVNAPGSEFPSGTTLVVSGAADSVSDLNGLHQPISTVVVNNQPVDVLDAAGNFFTRVTLLPGQNTLEFTATDVAGNVSTTSITITGTQPSPGQVDFSQFADVTQSISGVYGRTSYNDRDSTLLVDLATRNDGTFVADAPLLVGIKNLDPRVEVIGADGVTPDGIPYYDLSDSSGRPPRAQCTVGFRRG